jgi:hypothetical protein
MVGDEFWWKAPMFQKTSLRARFAAISELIDRQRRNQFSAKLSENSQSITLKKWLSAFQQVNVSCDSNPLLF